MKIRSLFGLLTTTALFASSVWVFTNQQEISDWWRLREFIPSSEIVLLSERSGMNETGQRLFYVHAPELLPKENFSGKCAIDEETIVLGCYITDTKIYVFDVDDERLEGIEEVTAAHEMLHAAYDRLSNDERERIDEILLETFKNLNDERLNQTIANYRKRDPSVVPNELHSILGTEVRQLPEVLEEYYRKYFNDRLAVVSLAETYEAAFTELEDRIDEFDERLTQLKRAIDERQTNLDFLNEALKRESAELERLRNNPEAFNAAIPSYNQKVRDFNASLAILTRDIEAYNQLVNERNAIALEERELIQALDTNFQEL